MRGRNHGYGHGRQLGDSMEMAISMWNNGMGVGQTARPMMAMEGGFSDITTGPPGNSTPRLGDGPRRPSTIWRSLTLFDGFFLLLSFSYLHHFFLGVVAAAGIRNRAGKQAINLRERADTVSSQRKGPP